MVLRPCPLLAKPKWFRKEHFQRIVRLNCPKEDRIVLHPIVIKYPASRKAQSPRKKSSSVRKGPKFVIVPKENDTPASGGGGGGGGGTIDTLRWSKRMRKPQAEQDIIRHEIDKLHRLAKGEKKVETDERTFSCHNQLYCLAQRNLYFFCLPRSRLCLHRHRHRHRRPLSNRKTMSMPGHPCQ